MNKLFILLLFISVSFLMGGSAFSANKDRSESADELKVKIFCFTDNEGKDPTEKEINIFLSDKKIEQIIQTSQTSVGAGTNGFMRFYTVITIFYRQ